MEKKLVFNCEKCNFKCFKKQSYDRHLTTLKHKRSTYTNKIQEEENYLEINILNNFICVCGKSYKHLSSLCKHKKNCNKIINDESTISNNQPNLSSMVQIDHNVLVELLKQNQEFKQQILDIVKDGKYITNNNNTINNNQKFNMNFFLNEQCKDALDIMDFVSSLKLNLEDLENTGKIGYVKGISDIFLRGLRELDVYKRPIHCSDLKREVMYVKDNDVWEKDEDKTKVKKAIQHIAGRNFKQVIEWVDKNPEAKDVRTKKHDQYMNILSKCTGGIDKEEDNNLYNKIITNVAKEVHIDR
jgi:hypothetical protein